MTHLIEAHPMIALYLCFSALMAVVSALKAADETKSGLKALIAFLTALLSMQGLFAGYFRKPDGGLVEKQP